MSTRPHFERRPANLSSFAQLRLNVYMTVLSVALSPVLYVWNIVASKKAQQAVYGALWLSSAVLLYGIAVALRSIELGNSALLTWVLHLLGVDYPFPKDEGDPPRYLGSARPLVDSPKPQPQQLSQIKPADTVVQAPQASASTSLPLNSHVRALTYPHITQASDYESDDGEHSQCHPDFLVRPLHDVEHEATGAEQEAAVTPHSERHNSLSLTSHHLRALDSDDNHPLAQRHRNDSTAVTVSTGSPSDSPRTQAEVLTDMLHESPVSEHIPMIEEPVAHPEEPVLVDQRPPASPEALPPPYVSPPSSPPTASKEQYAFRPPVPPQNDVIEAAGPSSSESSANEESVPDAQPELALGRETLTVPSNSDTMELISPVESEVFVYPVDSSPPELVPVTMTEPESPEEDVFRYPAADPVEPTPTEPVAPVAPVAPAAPARRAFRDRHSDIEDTPASDPAPAYRPHSPHFGIPNTTARSHRYSLTADMLPAPEVLSPVPLPARAPALPPARTVTRESPAPSRVNSTDYNRYSSHLRQTSSPAPMTSGSVTIEDVNDASSDLGDASATGALGDARKKRRRKKNSKASRRSVVFSDDEPEVIGSASDWAMESGEESGTSATPVNQLDQRFSRQMSLPPVSSPLARSSMPPVRDSDFSPSLADMISPTSSVDSRGALPSYRDLQSPGSSRAASPAPSVGSVGSVGSNADGDWSARKVDAYGRWYQAMNKHQPVPQIPKLKQEMTACSPDELAKRLKLGAAAPPTKHTPILLGAQHGAGRGRFKSRR